MALWGGRFRFEDKSITKLDYDEPGERITVDIPSHPPGIFVGKFGEVLSETTTSAHFQPKQRIENPPYKLIQNFRLPQPLNDKINRSVNFNDEFLLTRDLDLKMDEVHLENNSSATVTWPPNVKNEWQIPRCRAPYCFPSNLQISGERKRLTSTYTEHLGTVGKPDRADIELPPRGIMVYGINTQLDTEYEDKFSASLLRPPDYYQNHATDVATRQVHRSSYPRWESSYTAMCRENLEAPNWVRDFLELPPGAPLPPVTRPFAPSSAPRQ